jgi:hypothetical protein
MGPECEGLPAPIRGPSSSAQPTAAADRAERLTRAAWRWGAERFSPDVCPQAPAAPTPTPHRRRSAPTGRGGKRPVDRRDSYRGAWPYVDHRWVPRRTPVAAPKPPQTPFAARRTSTITGRKWICKPAPGIGLPRRQWFLPRSTVVLRCQVLRLNQVPSAHALLGPASRRSHPRRTEARASDLKELVLAREDRRDRVVGEDVHDRLGEQGRDRQHDDLLRPADRVDRHRVRDGDLRDPAR